MRSEEHTSELQSHSDLVCRLLLEKKKQQNGLAHARHHYLLLQITHPHSSLFFFFNDTATTEIYTLSLHDALPICLHQWSIRAHAATRTPPPDRRRHIAVPWTRGVPAPVWATIAGHTR